MSLLYQNDAAKSFWHNNDVIFVSCVCWERFKPIIEHEDIIYVSAHETAAVLQWFCYQLIAKQSNKTATVSRPDPYVIKRLSNKFTTH